MTVHFKVCCIRCADEAEQAIAAGAAAVGLVGEMPNGPGQISDDDICEIAAVVHRRHGDKIWTTLLTSRTDGAAIADHIAATGVNTVQVVDAPASGAYAAIRKAHAHIRLIQVIHVEDAGAIDAARLAAQSVDVILLDSGKPSAAARTLGGTGDTHDWAISRQIIEAVPIPVFLAGGLGPDNVVGAIAAVGPYGVDICSGIRDKTDGYRLVPEKLEAFAAALRQTGPR